jgi:hypothetical protein
MILLKNLKYFQRAALGLLTMSALAGLLQAQSYYGGLRGAVVDQNGGGSAFVGQSHARVRYRANANHAFDIRQRIRLQQSFQSAKEL